VKVPNQPVRSALIHEHLRSIRNIGLLILLVVLLLSDNKVRATDLGCEGEDYYCQTDTIQADCSPQSGDCCAASWDEAADDTCSAFCGQYGSVLWDESGYQGTPFNNSEFSIYLCMNFRIHCACQGYVRH